VIEAMGRGGAEMKAYLGLRDTDVATCPSARGARGKRFGIDLSGTRTRG
jgi:hypothetical protein